MFELTGKVAIVTGASSGIGRACVVALAKQGAKVAAAARRLDKLTALADELTAKGYDVIPVPLDVTKPEEITEGLSQVVSHYSRLDILVNNAGVGSGASALELTEAEWDKTLDTNLKGYFFVAQAAAKEMIKNRWGRIINITSILSGGVGSGYPGVPHYCASKGGIVALTESLALELAPQGILVNAIGPGFIDTDMTTQVKESPTIFQSLLNRIALKRFGRPDEIAATVAFLASEEASYITGATLYADGGWTAA